MKFDYKPKATQMGSPIFKRTVHVALGCITFVCLTLVLSTGQSRDTSTSSAPSVALPKAASLLIPIEVPKETPKGSETPKTKLAKTDKSPIIQINPATPAPATSPAPVSKETLASKLISEVKIKTQPNLHTVIVTKKDTLSKIFTRLGISTKDLHEIMTTDNASNRLATLQPGQTLKLQVSKDKQIEQLVLEIAPGDTLLVSRKETGFQVVHRVQPLENQLAFGKGAIQDSLFSAAKRAGLDYNIISQMVEIFGWSIDFSLDLQPSDTFRVLYEEKYLDGTKIQTGHILAAEIVNGTTKHRAVRYTDKSGFTGYFSPDGYGMHQAFLRYPVNFTRISSHFGKRKHPVLHKMRQHKGVDYAAPRGTPVLATGAGKVVFVGTRGGYGKVVELQHGTRYTTLYAHLSRFPKELRVGKEVNQGQTIGFVGSTGMATGAHLHYEFRVDGTHRNPLTIALPKKDPLSSDNKRHFLAHAKEMLRLLDLHDHKIQMAKIDTLKNE